MAYAVFSNPYSPEAQAKKAADALKPKTPVQQQSPSVPQVAPKATTAPAASAPTAIPTAAAPEPAAGPAPGPAAPKPEAPAAPSPAMAGLASAAAIDPNAGAQEFLGGAGTPLRPDLGKRQPPSLAALLQGLRY